MRARLWSPIPQSLVPLLGLAVVCAASGWALAQHSRMFLLLPIVGALAALLLVFAHFGLRTLWAWAPLAVLTYPLGGPNANLTFNRLWIPALLALLLILPHARTRSRAGSRVLWALALLTVVIGLRTALTHGLQGDYAYGFRVWIDSLLLPLIIFAVVRRVAAVKEQGGERIAFALMIAGFLLALIGIGERIFGFELASSVRGGSVFFDLNIDQVRISGPYEAPPPYGLSLVLCLAATMYWILMRRREAETYLAAYVGIALELIAIFFNYFRVGWISAALVIVLSLGLRPRRFGRLLAVFTGAAIVVALAMTQLEGISAVSNRINNTQNIYARFGAYEQGIQMFSGKPIFGVGTNRYHDVASRLPPLRVHGVESVPDPHSSFVQVLAEDGAVGFVVLLALAFALWRLVHQFRRRATTHADVVLGGVLVAAVLTYLIFSLTLEMLPYGASNQFFAAIVGLAAGRLDRQTAIARRPGG